MRINELASSLDLAKLAALAEFLVRRGEDTASVNKTISAETFIRLANNMNIPLTMSQLKTLSTQPPLNGIIANVEGDDQDPASGKVIFKGAEQEQVTDTMSKDQARQTVDKMAKRAIDI